MFEIPTSTMSEAQSKVLSHGSMYFRASEVVEYLHWNVVAFVALLDANDSPKICGWYSEFTWWRATQSTSYVTISITGTPLGSGQTSLDVESLNCTVCFTAISLHLLPMPRFHQGLQCGTEMC